ncbi:MAG: hypothetical protein ACLFQT_09600, partial [Thiohalophilus sp.]
MSSTSVTHLKMLRQIEEVVDWLSGLQQYAEGQMATAQNFINSVNKCADTPLDPDDSVHDAIIESEDALKKCIEVLSMKKAAAITDEHLNGEHETAVVSEYDKAIH